MIHEKISAVQAEIAAIGVAKSRKNRDQGYAFRGIDDVYNALSNLMAKHGVVSIPQYSGLNYEQRATKSGGIMTHCTLRLNLTLACAQDDRIEVVAYGEALDTSDKATGKAMSYALKNAILQVFLIPTEASEDADATTPEQQLTPEQMAAVTAILDRVDGATTKEELNNIWREAKAYGLLNVVRHHITKRGESLA